MSTKKVDVLYNGKETLMDIEINEDNLYNSFLDIFRQKFNEKDPTIRKFKLTAINTRFPYLLIDENNIASIIKEKIENNAPLKLLLTKEEDYEELKRDSVNDKYLSGFVKEAPIDEEDFNDDEFILLDENSEIKKTIENKNIDKENEDKKKEEEEKINQMLTNSLNKKKDENKKEEIKKDKNNFDNENDIDNLNLNENLRLSNLDGNININSIMTDDEANKDNDDNKENSYKNNIENKNSIKYILPVLPLKIPKNNFKSEICSLCGNNILSFKYICSICENCNLCEHCEDIHIHPCFKYKTSFLSNITDTYKYIDKNYNYKIPIDSKKMTKLIRKEYNLKIVPMTDLQFSVRPNRRIDIPIKVLNLSDQEINSSQFIILIKNNKLINISYQVDKKFVIKPNEDYEINLLCRTSTTNSKEKVNIEIYSAELKIRMSSRLNFDLEIEVNDDKEDEKMNKDLNNDKYAIFHNKIHKKIISSMLYYNQNWIFDLKRLCQVLRDNKWDTRKSIDILSKVEK